MPRFACIGIAHYVAFIPSVDEITDSQLRYGQPSLFPASNWSLWPLQILYARILQGGKNMSVPSHRES